MSRNMHRMTLRNGETITIAAGNEKDDMIIQSLTKWTSCTQRFLGHPEVIDSRYQGLLNSL